MKLLILAHAYPEFVEEFYASRPELAFRSSNEQFRAFDRESHAWANLALAEALAPLGYETMVAITNVEPLQKTWAQEHGVVFQGSAWKTDIVERQVELFRPDLVFLTRYAEFAPHWIGRLREKFTYIRHLGVWCGMPFFSPEPFKNFDLIITCLPESETRFRSLGFNCRQVHHAFDRRVLEYIDPTHEQDIPLSIVGQLIRSPGYHEGRVRILERIVDDLDIAIFSSAEKLYSLLVLRHAARLGLFSLAKGMQRMNVPRKFLERLPLLGEAMRYDTPPPPPVSLKLRPHLRPAVYGKNMYQTLQRSEISLNIHGDVSARAASNRRLFEATGVGSCLLTDWKENLPTLFEPDVEIITYRSLEECVEKAKWLIQHPEKRREIALAGQRRTLSEHNFANRAEQLHDAIRTCLA